MPFALRPTGTPLTVLATLLPHSIVLRRAGTNQTAQDMMVDFSGTGREALYSAGAANAGYGGEADGVAVYCLPTADIRIGDVFRHSDGTYTVAWVSPPGWGLVDGNTLLIAWARASKARAAA